MWTTRSQAWWCMPEIPACGKQRQEDQEFKASLKLLKNPSRKKWGWKREREGEGGRGRERGRGEKGEKENQ